jgi:prepilin signal peptidase PulO-like enzyme (type II secretory pathway)
MESIFPALPEWFWYPICFLYGAIVGSFLNVLIYRLPQIEIAQDKTLSINGHSFCPRCRNYLKPYHNVPLLGFLFLRGRCAFCKVRISWRYFSVELLTACLWTVLYHQVSGRTGVSWVDYVGQALFASVLIAMIFIDLDHFIAPDSLNITAGVIAIARDAACIFLAYSAGQWVWAEYAPQFLYFGWLPRGLVGALAYGGTLGLVSFLGFVYYARGETESIGSVMRRFFTLEEWNEPEPTTESAATAPEKPEEAIGQDDEPEGEAVRIAFSPGFLAFVSALLLIPVAGVWAVLAFVVPLLSFLALSRKPGESVGSILGRFFSSDDQRGMPDDVLPEYAEQEEAIEYTPEELQAMSSLLGLAAIAPDQMTPEQVEAAAQITAEQREAVMAYEANQFAKEAESGSAGGMGLGDVKLAIAVGLLLGPALALLSLFFATALGAIIGIILIRRHRRRNARLAVPFVPFMAAGAIVVMLFGRGFIDWYLIQSGIKERPVEPEPPRRMRRYRPPGTPPNAPPNMPLSIPPSRNP